MNRIFLGFVLLSLSSMLQAQIVINEVCPANADINYDNDYYNFSPWVEIYNAGGNTVNISGYYLSDDVSQKTKWQIPTGASIPSKGFLLIWCDGLNTGWHTNFSLDSDGEELILSTPGLQQVDYIQFPKQYTNVAYGRTADGGSTWSYLVSPTPRTKNDSKAASMQLEKPELSMKAGRYTGVQTVSMSHALSSAAIYFTLDGTEPTISASRYTAPVSITKTTIVKAKAFHDLYIPSDTEVKTYFINEHTFTMPVVSISTKPAYLWNNIIGIYTDGTNGIPGNCQGNRVNWNQDWNRHAVFEYFDASGNRQFNQSVDIRIGGACSRNFPQKSFAIKARDKYGKKTIDEKLFDTKLSSRYGGFMLRNSGNDFNTTMFRDALMQSLPVGQMDVDYMAYQPATFYLNGEYWGIQNLREKIDGDFIESNYGIKKNDLDLIETWGNAIEGSSDAYYTYLNTLGTLNPTDPATFQFIDQHIDVQEFINYLAAEIYYGNTDWPGNNIKFWRQRSTNGKYRWILWDTDFGFALYTWASYATHPTLNFATDPNSGVDWPNPPWSTLHIRLVLQNPEFRNRFIQTLTTAMNTTFKPARVNQFIDDFQNRLKNEIPFHKQRWGGNIGDWNYEVQRLRDFATQRNVFMKEHTASFFNLNQQVRISAQVTSPQTGKVRLNGILLDEPLVNGDYFRNIPYTAEAVPMPGYQFKKWTIKKRESVVLPMIAQSSAWKYFDLGSLPASNWTTIGFNDATWASGTAQLGYGDGDEQTVVGYGSDANNKYITTYFRKQFTVTDITGVDNLQASVLFDDGVVVYLNGVEVYRNNMPTGTITNSTLAEQAIPVENVFNTFTIPNGILTNGTNVLAVEVHQNSPQSSDISFDFTLMGLQVGNETAFTATDLVVSDVAYSDISLEAEFEQALPITGIVINEFSANSFQVTDDFNEEEDWIELYNAGTQTVDLGNLFITDNFQNKTKHLIPAGTGKTSIAPGAYKVLWADEQPGQGPLHVNFKLSAEGEQIGLYQMVGSTLQTLSEVNFAAHFATTSYSRIPNATGPFLLTSQLTPGAENIFEIPVATAEEIENGIRVYPNPTQGLVRVESENLMQEIMVLNSLGSIVRQYPVNSTEASLQLNSLSPGLYVVTIRMGYRQVVKRIILK
ncbi:MAG: CotH kinase family protein [Cyclobacteriaceae bacterium]|nr:CotH kinase family protein [Cyclobacteriaceae bacterium]